MTFGLLSSIDRTESFLRETDGKSAYFADFRANGRAMWDALRLKYPVWRWPVMLRTIGGVALLVGTGGLLYLKGKMDSLPASSRFLGMDIGFLALLFLSSLSGLLLLIFRETLPMGTLLADHLGIVVGLFVTMPYGKFVHAVFRYAALVKNAIESLHEEN